MKKSTLLFIGCLIAVVTGCASIADQKISAKQAALGSWIEMQKSALDAGTIKRSSYYAEYYQHLNADPVTQYDLVAMDALASTLIPAARRMESGQISKEEFADIRRRVDVSIKSKWANLAAAEQQRRQQATATALQYYMLTKPVTTNCFGGPYSASCTSY